MSLVSAALKGLLFHLWQPGVQIKLIFPDCPEHAVVDPMHHSPGTRGLIHGVKIAAVALAPSALLALEKQPANACLRC